MKERFKGKSVVIIGSTGGLGSAYARAFADQGARLLLAGRDRELLNAVASELSGEVAVHSVEITDQQSIETLLRFAAEWSDGIDFLINATGVDIRKSLQTHKYEEIKKSLDVNLYGAICITKAFLPHMREEQGSAIVHMGGFADGHLAFPYYSVDVATRAGLFSFIESINRELLLEGRKVSLMYFSPSAADTKAEQPYHHIWKAMNISIVSSDQVASELLQAVAKQKRVYLMGGVFTSLFAKLNLLSPGLADALVLKKYGMILKKYFGSGNQAGLEELATKKNMALRKVAIGLVALSFVLYALLPVVPFLKIGLRYKASLTVGMMAVSEVVFWIGGAILGKEIVAKYKKMLNPCSWFCCKTKCPEGRVS